MKKIILSGIFTLMGLMAWSQSANDSLALDLIIFTGGDEIQCKITEISPTLIVYKNPGSDVIYSCSKDKVDKIRLAGGAVETITHDQPVAAPPAAEYTFEKGVKDAAAYYPAEKTGEGGTFITTFLFGPIVGLIPAISCSSVKPKLKNLAIPNTPALKSPAYVAGYTHKAHMIKRKKVWKAYGFGILAELGFIFLVSAATH